MRARSGPTTRCRAPQRPPGAPHHPASSPIARVARASARRRDRFGVAGRAGAGAAYGRGCRSRSALSPRRVRSGRTCPGRPLVPGSAPRPRDHEAVSRLGHVGVARRFGLVAPAAPAVRRSSVVRWAPARVRHLRTRGTPVRADCARSRDGASPCRSVRMPMRSLVPGPPCGSGAWAASWIRSGRSVRLSPRSGTAGRRRRCRRPCAEVRRPERAREFGAPRPKALARTRAGPAPFPGRPGPTQPVGSAPVRFGSGGRPRPAGARIVDRPGACPVPRPVAGRGRGSCSPGPSDVFGARLRDVLRRYRWNVPPGGASGAWKRDAERMVPDRAPTGASGDVRRSGVDQVPDS